MKIKQLLNESLSQKDIDDMTKLLKSNDINEFIFRDYYVEIQGDCYIDNDPLIKIPVEIVLSEIRDDDDDEDDYEDEDGGDFAGGRDVDFVISNTPNLKTLINIPGIVANFTVKKTGLETMDFTPLEAYDSFSIIDNNKLKTYKVPNRQSGPINMTNNAFEKFSHTFQCDSEVDMSGNKLKTFDNCPTQIHGYFNLSGNKFESLKDIHQHLTYVADEFDLSGNPIKDGFLDLLKIKGIGRLVFTDNVEIEKIINDNLKKGRQGQLAAQVSMIEAGFEGML